MTLQDDNNIAKPLCDNKLEVGIIIDCALLCWISVLLAKLTLGCNIPLGLNYRSVLCLFNVVLHCSIYTISTSNHTTGKTFTQVPSLRRHKQSLFLQLHLPLLYWNVYTCWYHWSQLDNDVTKTISHGHCLHWSGHVVWPPMHWICTHALNMYPCIEYVPMCPMQWFVLLGVMCACSCIPFPS